MKWALMVCMALVVASGMLWGQSADAQQTSVEDVEYMSFGDCKARTLSMEAKFDGLIPVVRIVDTGILYVVKFYAQDKSEVLVTCSKPDGKRVMTVTR